ncbi:MAG: Spy/CpxP family protein refolding chaperone, partial [Armatimonadetes bacterium]|nr:Spy/CpxP family protein refolding chaperone [Armatimonadota bacterium]
MNPTKQTMTAIFIALLAVASASPVLAQRGGGGGFGGPGGPGGMRGRQPMPVSAATLPLEVMNEYLALTPTQTAQIKTITQTLRETNRPPRPEPGLNGERPAPPTREEREAQRKTMEAAMQKASTEIISLLTDTQKPRLATLVKGFDVLQAVRIPPFAVQDLKLTDDQWIKIAALGTGAKRESVTALLTDVQIAALESARPPRG